MFIRLGIVYFVVFAVDALTKAKLDIYSRMTDENDAFVKALVFIFLIIGLLLFAKKAPQFICDVLGIKGTDNISGMFKRAGGMFGALRGGTKTAASNLASTYNRLKGKGGGTVGSAGRALRSAAAGFFSAAGRGMYMAAQGKGYNETRNNAFKDAVAARNRRADRVDNIYTSDYDQLKYAKDRMKQRLGIPDSNAWFETVNKNAAEIRNSIDAQVKHGLTKLEDVKGKVFKSSKSDGFGTVNGEVVSEMNLATARARASAEIGSVYYNQPTGQYAEQLDRQINKQVSRVDGFSRKYQEDLANIERAKNSGASADVITRMTATANTSKQNLDAAQAELDRLREERKGEKVVVTDEIRAQWDVVVHSLEKEARFQNESDLLANGDVDAVVGLEKTLGLLQQNYKDLDNDGEIKALFKNMTDAAHANGKEPPFKSVGDMLEKLQGSQGTTDKGLKKYDVDASALEAAKQIAEAMAAQTNKRALESAARAKRTQQVEQNNKNG